MDMEAAAARLREIIDASQRIVFFGGAGVSTESGIPDFRSASGLYHQPDNGDARYLPEEMLSADFFLHNTQLFYRYYFSSLVHPTAQPNAAHRALAQLEKEGKLSAVITQNIDGLHQQAGSKEVIELHGSVKRNYCINCRAFYPLEDMLAQKEGIPRCSACQGFIKPDVVLYGESLPQEAVNNAIARISQADALIVGGTSLSVYPAAGLLRYFQNGPLVLINRDQTHFDTAAQLIIRENIGGILAACVKFCS